MIGSGGEGWLCSLLQIPFLYCGYGLSIINIFFFSSPIRVPRGTVPPVRPLESTCTGVLVFAGITNGGNVIIQFGIQLCDRRIRGNALENEEAMLSLEL